MAINPPTNNAFEAFLQKPRGDKLIRLHISRNTLIAFVISILIHALILFFVVPKIKFDQVKESPTFEVVLEQPKKAEIIEKPLPQEPIPERLTEPSIEQPKPPKVMTQKPSKNAKPPVFSVPDVLATNKRTAETLSQKENKPKEAPTDMMTAINARRAEREALEVDAARQNAEAAARETGPSEEEKRDANIKRNFQNGTNGIFEITSLSNTNATFSFLGWTSSLSNARREFFEVEARSGQDVRLVMIRRMISLIREHYQGDFDWESHRLGRTIVKSARVEDSAELEEFLMQEFFGRNYKTVP